MKRTVKEIKPSFWSNPNLEKGESVRNIIQTDFIVNVEKAYKNKPYNDSEVTVRIDKGTVGDTTLESEGVPDFNVGDEVVLFLSKDDSDLANPNEVYYVVTGMSQGKFTLKKPEVGSKSTDKTFVNRLTKDNTKERDSFKLSTLEQEINTTLDDLKKNPIKKMSKEEIEEINKQTLGN